MPPLTPLASFPHHHRRQAGHPDAACHVLVYPHPAPPAGSLLGTPPGPGQVVVCQQNEAQVHYGLAQEAEQYIKAITPKLPPVGPGGARHWVLWQRLSPTRNDIAVYPNDPALLATLWDRHTPETLAEFVDPSGQTTIPPPP